jgi:acyl-CoA hydrolase
MDVKMYITHHLVKSEDLNHHGTLYAGRTAEWFVESGFIACAGVIKPENIVCLKIHGMTFLRPVQPGSIAHFTSKIVYTGKARLVAHIKLTVNEEEVLNGFITFVSVDKNGVTLPHGVTITPTQPEDIALAEEAKNLR